MSLLQDRVKNKTKLALGRATGSQRICQLKGRQLIQEEQAEEQVQLGKMPCRSARQGGASSDSALVCQHARNTVLPKPGAQAPSPPSARPRAPVPEEARGSAPPRPSRHLATPRAALTRLLTLWTTARRVPPGAQPAPPKRPRG